MKSKIITEYIPQVAAALLHRVLARPLTTIIPRARKQWVIVGRNSGKFLDNTKYLACWISTNKAESIDLTYICNDKAIAGDLEKHSVTAKSYGRPGALWRILRAGTIIVDDSDQDVKSRSIYYRGARTVQIWHGVPLKKLELVLHKQRVEKLAPAKRPVMELITRVRGRFPTYGTFVSTSTFYTEHAFSKCFNARRYVNLGYPRNDILLDEPAMRSSLVNLNVDLATRAAMQDFRASGGRTVLYAPTFRLASEGDFFEKGLNLAAMSEYAANNNLLLIIKPHPLMMDLIPGTLPPRVMTIDPESDIYPLLRDVDMLLTDYSSLCYDFLLLDRPIIFFPFDYASYVGSDFGFLFDYEDMTPGPKVHDMDSLLAAMDTLLNGQPDQWKGKRAYLCELAFGDNRQGSSRRLWEELAGENDDRHPT